MIRAEDDDLAAGAGDAQAQEAAPFFPGFRDIAVVSTGPVQVADVPKVDDLGFRGLGSLERFDADAVPASVAGLRSGAGDASLGQADAGAEQVAVLPAQHQVVLVAVAVLRDVAPDVLRNGVVQLIFLLGAIQQRHRSGASCPGNLDPVVQRRAPEHPERQVADLLRAAEVLRQHPFLSVWEAFREAAYAGPFGALGRADRLRLVAGAAEVAVGREGLEDLVLQRVDVLHLVDQDVLDLRGDRLPQGGVVLERDGDEVLDVDLVVLLVEELELDVVVEALLELPVVSLRLFGLLCIPALAEIGPVNGVLQRSAGAEVAGVDDGNDPFEEEHADAVDSPGDELGDLLAAGEPEAFDPERRRVTVQQLLAPGLEGPASQSVGIRCLGQHLRLLRDGGASRFSGGEDEDLFRRHTRIQQEGRPGCEDRRFPGPDPSPDQQVAARVGGGAPLLLAEIGPGHFSGR